jgi:hypothetical protein
LYTEVFVYGGTVHGVASPSLGAAVTTDARINATSDREILAEDWQQHGREVFKRVRRESPASYLKVCAMLVPREMKLEHSGGVEAMSDEALENAIEALERMLGAKGIEGVAQPVPALPPPLGDRR